MQDIINIIYEDKSVIILIIAGLCLTAFIVFILIENNFKMLIKTFERINWNRLGNVDRRIIFLLISIGVLIPLLKPGLVSFPIETTENTQIVYDSISDLDENSKILVSFAYGASTKPEIHPMSVALLNQLFTQGVKVYIISLFPEGVQMSRDAMSIVDKSKLFDLEYGVDYVMFDYKVGNEIVIKNLVEDFRSVYAVDINKTSITELPMMKNIAKIKDFDFVFDFSAGVPGNEQWVQFACDPTGVPLSSGCTSIMVTDAIPYIHTGQLKGILAGMPGAAEYEQLVFDLMNKERKNGYETGVYGLGSYTHFLQQPPGQFLDSSEMAGPTTEKSAKN